MDLSLTDGLAALALLLSVIAMVNSDRSANSAESAAQSAIHANNLAQHNERLAIYKSLQKFHLELQIRFDSLPESALLEFHDAVNISEFYYPQDVSDQLMMIILQANDFLAMRNRCKDYATSGSIELESLNRGLQTLQKQGKNLRELCKKCDEDLRKHLRVEPRF